MLGFVGEEVAGAAEAVGEVVLEGPEFVEHGGLGEAVVADDRVLDPDGDVRVEVRAADRADGVFGGRDQPVAGVCTMSTGQWTAGLGEPLPCFTDDRPNALSGGASYESAPLSSDLRLSGPIAAHGCSSAT